MKKISFVLITVMFSLVANAQNTTLQTKYFKHPSGVNFWWEFVNNGPDFVLQFGKTTAQNGPTMVPFVNFTTDKRIGINNPIPKFTLDLNGDLNIAGKLYWNSVEFNFEAVEYWKKNNAGDLYNKSGRVGINQNAPSYSLDVTGDINYTGKLYQNSTALNLSALEYWNLTGNDISRLTGKVGIGIAIPTEALDVVGNIHYTGNLIQGTTTLNFEPLNYWNKNEQNLYLGILN